MQVVSLQTGSVVVRLRLTIWDPEFPVGVSTLLLAATGGLFYAFPAEFPPELYQPHDAQGKAGVTSVSAAALSHHEDPVKSPRPSRHTSG